MSTYRTDSASVQVVYQLVKEDNIPGAIAFITSSILTEDQNEQQGASSPLEDVMKFWIGLQCDINNIEKDVAASEKLAWAGVDYGLRNGMNRQTAVLLHNIFAFYAPNWDEGVDPMVIPRLVDASEKQVYLRKDLVDRGSYGWALWDLGMAYLISGDLIRAIHQFDEAIAVHRGNIDGIPAATKESENSANWAILFKGKAKFKLSSDETERMIGRQLMETAHDVILRCGEDWEKEEVVKILATIGPR